MPTLDTVLDNIFRHIAAAIYILVLVAAIVLFVYELTMCIKENREEKKKENKYV